MQRFHSLYLHQSISFALSFAYRNFKILHALSNDASIEWNRCVIVNIFNFENNFFVIIYQTCFVKFFRRIFFIQRLFSFFLSLFSTLYSFYQIKWFRSISLFSLLTIVAFDILFKSRNEHATINFKCWWIFRQIHFQISTIKRDFFQNVFFKILLILLTMMSRRKDEKNVF